MISFEPHVQPIRRVAVVRWTPKDELAEALAVSLETLGHTPMLFDCTAAIPDNAEIVFSFAPYGDFMALVNRLAALPNERRPLFVHWNTEGIPDLHLPWLFVYPISQMRSWAGRVTSSRITNRIGGRFPLTWLNQRMLRYRYVGDYYYAYGRGVLDIFADSSAVYAEMHRKHGLPTTYLPWGYVPAWAEELDLERDVDVLWLGKRGTDRRSHLLERVRGELKRHGVEIYMADNEEHPFLFRRDRTIMLNRAKITLNITRTWYDDNFSRFSMAAPNRSLVVSEPMLPHCPEYQAGVHYVAAPIEELSATILHYLQADDERRAVTDAAYQLLTQNLTLVNGMGRIMEQANALLNCSKRSPGVAYAE